MNMFTMPGMTDLVWMGANQVTPDIHVGLMHSDPDLMLEHDAFYPSHNSTSNQSLDDIHSHHSATEMSDSLGLLGYDEEMVKSECSDYADSCERYNNMMQSTATQTANFSNRKIKPVKHPGLVLKTPIAYQSNTDPSVIPIEKDGMAVCEKCGAIGVKHAFYTRERRFCSMACARGYSGLTPLPEPITSTHQNPIPNLDENYKYAEYKFEMEMQDDMSNMVSEDPIPQLPNAPKTITAIEENLPYVRRKNVELTNTHNWDSQLCDQNFIAAPVSCFKHAPISDIWANICVGMKVEVENTDCDDDNSAFSDSFWVATVLKITGYKALMRYEGFGLNSSKDFWVSLCSGSVHPVGWCATRGKPLIPPKTIQDKYNDWKNFLVKRLTGARTLPSSFSNKVLESMRSRFECGMNLEVVDKNRISQVKVAMVHKIVGKRLHVRYYDSPPEDNGFWCHEDSPLIHPVGWARKVGHTLDAPVDYLERINEGIFDEDDARENLFLLSQTGLKNLDFQSGFCEGMKLEAIDPLNLSSICVATVMDVLKCGYIMIRIDSYDADETGADWFCYHTTSPCIFPAGFCQTNNIPLTPPKGYTQENFNWSDYLRETNNIAAQFHLFNREVPRHGFVEGAKMEAADLMDPRLVCVATVAKVVGRLLKVHFDGWEEEYDQWLDCESPDIYPVGWCQLVGHKLEGPRQLVPVTPVNKIPKGVKKRGRKKKPPNNGGSTLPLKTSSPVKEEKVEKITQIKEEEEEDIENDNEDDDSIKEPEMGQEPQGPDQSLPTPTPTPAPTEPPSEPPSERKATSYISNSGNSSPKVIPRLVDSSGGNCDPSDLCPLEWNVFDVAQFLRVNDCANYCDTFSKQKIDGKTLLELTKDEIINFTGMKVGPSLKIYDLIQQLKIKVNPAQSRLMKANIKKFL